MHTIRTSDDRVLDNYIWFNKIFRPPIKATEAFLYVRDIQLGRPDIKYM